MPTDQTPAATILDRAEIERTLDRLASEIDGSVPRDRPLVLVGIQRRGDVIADALATRLAASRGPVPTGSLDITLYRDDFAQIGALPMIGTSDIDHDIDGAHVIIVDDVLHTGRTIRAALNELSDFGRAAKVELCVLVDRGGRQLPVQPDYTGQRVEVPEGREVAVRVAGLDNTWAVDLVDLEGE